jgi:hypothetical protein
LRREPVKTDGKRFMKATAVGVVPIHTLQPTQCTARLMPEPPGEPRRHVGALGICGKSQVMAPLAATGWLVFL